MSVKRLHIPEQLTVIAAVDQHLAVSLDSFREQCKGSLVENLLIGNVRLLLLFRVGHFISVFLLSLSDASTLLFNQ